MPLNSLNHTPGDAPAARLEHAVTLLRRRIEQHADRESQLNRLYHDWQNGWNDHYSLMTRHLAQLEAHLSAWMQHWRHQPRLTVVGLNESEQAFSDN